MSKDTIADHLDVLGVTWGASADVVRQAWKKAIKASHPDVIGRDGHAAMEKIQRAYAALKHGAPDYRKQTIRMKRVNLGSDTYDISLSIRRELHKNATVKAEQTLGIHVPHTLITRGRHLNFVFDVAALRAGDYLVLPTLYLENESLTIETKDPTLFAVSSGVGRGWSKTLIDDNSDRAIVGYENMAVSVSSYDE